MAEIKETLTINPPKELKQPIAVVFSAKFRLAEIIFNKNDIEYVFMNISWPDIKVIMLDSERSYKRYKEYRESKDGNTN